VIVAIEQTRLFSSQVHLIAGKYSCLILLRRAIDLFGYFLKVVELKLVKKSPVADGTRW